MKIILLFVFIITLFNFGIITQQAVAGSKPIFAEDLLRAGNNSASTTTDNADENELIEPIWSDLICNADLIIPTDGANLERFPTQKIFKSKADDSWLKPADWIYLTNPNFIDL